MSEKILKQLDSVQPNEPVIFCGSITMPLETFNAMYVEPLRKAIAKQAQIRVGCAQGCDALVQQYCADNGYENVQVYVPSEAKEVAYGTTFTRIDVAGGFKARDRAMQVGCKHIVGFFSQYAGAASGTAANILSIAAKNGQLGADCVNLDGYAVAALLRQHSMPFDQALSDHVQSKEALTAAAPKQ